MKKIYAVVINGIIHCAIEVKCGDIKEFNSKTENIIKKYASLLYDNNLKTWEKISDSHYTMKSNSGKHFNIKLTEIRLQTEKELDYIHRLRQQRNLKRLVE